MATSAAPAGVWQVRLDTGFAERAGEPFAAEGFEQRVGIEGRLPRGFTVVAALGFSDGRNGGVSPSYRVETLKDFGRGAMRFAAGLGMVREREGGYAAVGRLVLGRSVGHSDLFGNVSLERSFEGDRDAVDLMTTIAWARRIGRSFSAGIELVGEDLEGLWEAGEAEGGARLLVGPTLRLAPPSSPFSFSLIGGPILRASKTARSSGASRDLAGRNGYVLRASIGYRL